MVMEHMNSKGAEGAMSHSVRGALTTAFSRPTARLRRELVNNRWRCAPPAADAERWAYKRKP